MAGGCSAAGSPDAGDQASTSRKARRLDLCEPSRAAFFNSSTSNLLSALRSSNRHVPPQVDSIWVQRYVSQFVSASLYALPPGYKHPRSLHVRSISPSLPLTHHTQILPCPTFQDRKTAARMSEHAARHNHPQQVPPATNDPFWINPDAAHDASSDNGSLGINNSWPVSELFREPCRKTNASLAVAVWDQLSPRLLPARRARIFQRRHILRW